MTHGPRSAAHAMQVVGIGASAGGLEAMLELFPRLARTGHTTYVVAQHMGSSAQTDLMTRLLNQVSALPVRAAQDRQTLVADTIYLLPSGANGRVEGLQLTLEPAEPRQVYTPSVNVLFASMAESVRERARGLILSGAGRDGVEGCLAIRSCGGVALAQEPASAKFSGMPAAAIAAGAVDHVLAPALLPAALTGSLPRTGAATARPGGPDGRDLPAVSPADLDDVLQQLRHATGVDFSGYKPDTLQRRLAQRIGAVGLHTLAAYRAYLQRHPQEFRALQQRFLVSYSLFFRDAAVFDALAECFRGVFSRLPPGQPIRIWVPGCATGEEVYTLAILLAEWQAPLAPPARHPVELLGTDLNPEAIRWARRGRYGARSLKGVSAERSQRWFAREADEYCVVPELQAGCHFEVGNVLQEAPSGRFDLVSCRNLLIYLKPAAQDQVLHTIHQRLAEDGCLLLAPSETLGVAGQSLFTQHAGAHKLFGRRRVRSAAGPSERRFA